MIGTTSSSADLSAHRTRTNVRPAAVRVETAGDSVAVLEDTTADPSTRGFVTA